MKEILPLGTFHALQSASTLSNGLVLYMGCLACQTTEPCGYESRNFNTLFKIQGKWQSLSANGHQIMDKYGIPTKSTHSDLNIFILYMYSEFHGSEFKLGVPLLTIITVNFVHVRIYCALFIT